MVFVVLWSFNAYGCSGSLVWVCGVMWCVVCGFSPCVGGAGCRVVFRGVTWVDVSAVVCGRSGARGAPAPLVYGQCDGHSTQSASGSGGCGPVPPLAAPDPDCASVPRGWSLSVLLWGRRFCPMGSGDGTRRAAANSGAPPDVVGGAGAVVVGA